MFSGIKFLCDSVPEGKYQNRPVFKVRMQNRDADGNGQNGKRFFVTRLAFGGTYLTI